MTCSIESCERQARAQGLCRRHYDQQRANGTLVVRQGQRRPIEDRFWEKVNKGESCWLWTATVNAGGYGTFFPQGRGGVRAHRWSYEHLVGPIPEGLDLDHLCRVRHCVNPAHLEPVTRAENVRRGLHGVRNGKTHCNHGHKFTPETSHFSPSGRRHCRICRAAARRASS